MTPEMCQSEEIGTDLFQTVVGIEVWENMRVGGKSSLNARYNLVESNIANYITGIASGDYSEEQARAVVVAALGPSGAAKGSFNMGFMRLFGASSSLRQVSAELGVTLRVVPTLFALSAPAAQLPTISEDFRIPGHLKHGEFSPEHYAKITALEYTDIDRLIRYASGQKNALVLLAEGIPTAYPKDPYPGPLQLEGTDRGVSKLYKLCWDSRTRGFTYIGALYTESAVVEYNERLRSGLGNDEDWLKQLRQGVNYTITLNSGEEIDITDTPDHLKEPLVKLMRWGMASPKAIRRNTEELKVFRWKLWDEGTITSPTQKAYQEFIRKQLQFPLNHFWHTDNRFFQGDKTYDLNYLLGSLQVRLYPEIIGNIDPELLGYVQKNVWTLEDEEFFNGLRQFH